MASTLVVLRIGHTWETLLSYGVWNRGVAWTESPCREIRLVCGRRTGGRVVKSEACGQVRTLSTCEVMRTR